MIPTLSAPLSKLIRTGEGVLLYAFNLTAAVLSAVGDVAPGVALKYAAIFNAVAFASRQVLKAIAVTQPIAGGAPIPFAPAGVTIDTALAEIAATEQAAAAFQSKPGNPAGAVVTGTGLAADPSATK